ncbi:MAG TPA: chemotaxis protein CheA [Steroidobacteraceae bacterium]|jgi:two-component system chemotaxis sensor kinase CheA
MAFDPEMAEIVKMFFQESKEALDVMEAGLLSLSATTDLENISTIFRAAHSIKGGSATFGFTGVAEFTHGVETLLDEMRSGTRAIETETIQTLLQACDCLREMIVAAESEQPHDELRVAKLNQEIAALLAQSDKASAPSVVPSPADPRWQIAFRPVPDLLRLRNEPTRMFAELARLGAFTCRADVSEVPTLDAIDPESCFLAWDLEVKGAVPKQTLDEIFDWVDTQCHLEFNFLGGELPQPEPAAKAQHVPAAAPPHPAAARPVPSGNAQKSGGDSGSIRVATERLDNIINLVGELLITQSMLSGFAERSEQLNFDLLRQGLSQLSRNTRELQESVMQIRMLPISFAFNRFPRLVHDLSHKLGKKVELKLTGEGTELDKTVLEKITDPLVHLVRNSLDHGLETPECRLAAGKTETGTLELSAFHEGGNIIIEVSDDGGGLNKSKILKKARERGLVKENQELTDEQVDNLIFLPGFSTAEQVSDLSGRGVGMDVVRQNINDLGGDVQIHSREGSGSTVRIRLPLTLAILDGQLVRVGKETYIISLLAIVETIQVDRERLSTIAGRSEVFRLREEYLPILKLCDQFGVEPDSRNAEDGLLVVIEAEGRRVGILVDDLLAQQQVVIKSLESNYKSVPGIAGATILGDGAVALILDVATLVRSIPNERRAARAA